MFVLIKIPSRFVSVKSKEVMGRFLEVRNLRELEATGAMGDSRRLLRRDWANLNP
jgi:hypothetical protein